MLKFVVSRLLQFPLILAVIYLTTVALVWIAPGDPFAASSEKVSPEKVAALQAQYHTDSFFSFVTHYGSRALIGDFGPSLSRRGYDVNQIIGDALPVSIAIGALAVVIATFTGVFIGTLAAVRRNGVIDYVSLAIALIGVSVPSFVVATTLLGAFAFEPEPTFRLLIPLLHLIVLLIVASFWWAGRLSNLVFAIAAVVIVGLGVLLTWLYGGHLAGQLADTFPLGGWPGSSGRGYDHLDRYDGWAFGAATWDYLRHMILPAVALSLLPMAYVVRLTRVSMIDVLGSDYVRTARAKGLSKFKVVFKHCLRNAFLPVLSFLGPATANVLVGSFVVERIFNIPGLGTYFIESVQFRDQPMILGTVIVYSALLLTLNLVVDILYGVIDPRISVSEAGQ